MADPKNSPQPPSEDLSVNEGAPDARGRHISPWAWIPTVYFAQGLQYVIVTQLFVVVFFTMGISLGETMFWIGWLSFPWTLKPLWGPLVDRYWTKRGWTYLMQLIVGLCFLASAFTLMIPGEQPFIPGRLELPFFFYSTVALLFLLAFAGASHDIACDGYYMLGLSEKQQAFYVGIRSTVFRLAMMFVNGVLIWMAGVVQDHTGLPPVSMEVQVKPKEAIVEQAPAAPAIGEADEETGQAIIVDPPLLVAAAGDSTTVTLRLKQAPPEGTTQVVVLKFDDGDKSISIAKEKDRVELDAENWEKGVAVPIHIDKKIKGESAATFRALAGNIPFSWMVVCLVSAAIFLFVAVWHKFILPYPVKDGSDATDRPPFIVPLMALFFTVGVPFGIAYGIYAVLGSQHDAIMTRIIGEDPDALAKKGFDTFFNFGRVLLILALVLATVYIKPIWRPVGSFFRKMSDVSRIGFADVFGSFFSKEKIGVYLGFILVFRIGEVQIGAIKNVFLLDSIERGGLALSMGELAFVNTIIYLIPLTVGGMLGGFVIAKYGLKRVVWPMVIIMHAPNLLFLSLSWHGTGEMFQSLFPTSANEAFFAYANFVIGAEAFGYGFGLSLYLFVMILAAQGPYKTAHYALCTGFMALGAMIPTMFCGYLADAMGYFNYFFLVILTLIPGMLLIPFIPIDPNFGKK